MKKRIVRQCPLCISPDYTYDDLRPEVRTEIERAERENDYITVPKGNSIREWLLSADEPRDKS